MSRMPALSTSYREAGDELSGSRGMSDLDQQVAALRTRIDSHHRARLQAEADRNRAQGALSAAWSALQAEFPEVHDIAEAQSLLGQLEAAAAAEVARVTAVLEAAGG
jgi:hypothetical protein